MRRACALVLIAACGFAQGTTPKPAPADYDVHVSDGPLDIGAEYMVHSFSNGEQMYIAERFLVVEIAVYPVMKGDPVNIDMSKIGLRLNHKNLLKPVAPGQVAGTLRQSPFDMQRQSPISGSAGAGPVDIPIGNSPYPPQQRRMPNPPRAPEPGAPGGIERQRPATAEEVLMQTALPPGPHKGTVSGFVYFYFTGKPSSLKSVELEYNGLTLKLK